RGTTEKPKRPLIFQYHDYRAFFKDWFNYRKELDKDFSMRGLAGQTKLSTGYLPSVITGNRPISGKALAKIIPKLGLSQNEAAYLELMVTLSDGENQNVRVNAMNRM